ncbi:hypothetical protein CK489_15060 [Bradyrhizobium sp. UFLA03-84]|uniref:hypothetical protein n=1 Tax=Bradyrhizobium sp. UFLA03-84 TaxID=418599 RepID=UPI000BADF7C1|nr:hypothetical protein [Bradyrhizobium sp. UFLA03-84]PAY07125.1 hypothetical protein CK489_15060 [Bradyrhizobium sp. UFLA03-84]
MVWKDFGSSLAITRRRRIVATALMYGLTLTVRLTSTTSADTDASAQAFQGANPITSVMINDNAPIVDGDWLAAAVQPIAFRRGGSLTSDACRPACETAARTSFVSGCAERR